MITQTFGKPQILTVTGATCLTSANANIIGICFQGSATGSIQIWAGTTATVTAAGAEVSPLIRGYSTTAATSQAATYLSYPAYCSGGITVNVGDSLDVKITLFWNPAGGA